MKVLVINCGSSSIKYRLLDMRGETELARGVIERIGQPAAEIRHTCGNEETQVTEPVADYEAGVRCLVRLLLQVGEPPPLNSVEEIEGVGHRVVHGGEQFSDSVVIDDTVVQAVRGFCELAPLHNPVNLAGIEAGMHNLSHCPHVGVFDTAFFQTMPPHAYVYALPYEWYAQKRVRRYGFHGTSHRYVSLAAAERLGRPEPNLVTLHLGNGCSATCVRQGKAIDQSMGLTPLEGLVMGTRCGDVDPAIVFHLSRLGMSLDEIRDAMENRSGLLGLSGVSHDLRDVHAAAQEGNERAGLALDVFAHRVRKYLGAFVAQLGRCDAVVFTGGIGEKAAFLRAKILDGFAPIGIELDAQRNDQQSDGAFRVSTEASATQVWVIPTNEELMIARDTSRLIRRA